ncbi:hypothetical protein KDA23_03960 [Candidatus Saccharibacteria bacterium]|nr:hypothetical protein [Candidatus Saccharibacteria bacterium]
MADGTGHVPVELGQFTLEGDFVADPKPVDPTRSRNSLSRALDPGYLGRAVRNYMDLTPEMLEYAKAKQLQPHLIDVPSDFERSPFAVSYTDPRTHRERYIALTAQEAKIVPRSVPALSRSARIVTEAAVQTDIPTDEDLSRAQRSKAHVLEPALPKMQAFVKTLRSQDELAAKFVVAATGSNAGLSLMGGEARMREQLTYFTTFIIGDMLRAYASQRGLTASQHDQLCRAVDYNMVFTGAARIGMTRDYAELAHEYLGHKIQIVDQRIKSVERDIRRFL